LKTNYFKELIVACIKEYHVCEKAIH